MAEEDKDQRTEEPSAKRLRETREKGQFANSKEVSSVFVLMASIIAFSLAGSYAWKDLMLISSHIFSALNGISVTQSGVYLLFQLVSKQILIALAPIVLTIMVFGLFANLIQTGGPNFSLDPLEPKFSKLNPLKGMKRFFSKQALVELIKSIAKIVIVGYVAFSTVRDEFGNLPYLVGMNSGQILVYISQISLRIMIHTFWILVLLAIFDYGFQFWSFRENLRMTKQEVKDERKQTEGDPQIKTRIRGIQHQIARKRMMAAVPEADVVITNPTHVAVALQYKKDDIAPIVTAKGTGFIAAKIKEIAREKDVPLVEDRPLAQLLNKTIQIGQYVPDSLYKAVAEILAYVYRLKKRVI